MTAIDWRCYLITAGTSRATVERAAAAAAAGAGVVQVRAKDATTRELLELSTMVARAVADLAPNTRVLVDDRADVAWAARRAGEPVHGVHVGWDDLPPRDVRALLGPDAIIGLTTGTSALVKAAEELADVIITWAVVRSGTPPPRTQAGSRSACRGTHLLWLQHGCPWSRSAT